MRTAETKDMTMAMKEAVVTVLYKGGGKDRNKCKSYRPVSVTPMEYRVMMKAVQLKLQGAVEAVLGRTQMAHMRDGRYAHDNTILLAEAARKLEAAGQSGVALMLDNSAAFDRVRHDFMHEIFEAMGFPAGFREFMCTVYRDLKYRVKVNGIIGEQAGARNGVRQGCPASALAFLLSDSPKPIVVTGSQIPLLYSRNDAILNLMTSIAVAGSVSARSTWLKAIKASSIPLSKSSGARLRSGNSTGPVSG